MMQIVQEHKSIWQIKNYYLKDAKKPDEKKFWQKLIGEKEKHVKELRAFIKKEMK